MPRNGSGGKSAVEEIKWARNKAGEEIKKRMKEFESFKDKESVDWFVELCFCILTANFSAERAIKIQKEIDRGFLEMDLNTLSRELKRLGHRFPNARAKYIVEARRYAKKIKEIIQRMEEKEARDWLVKEIKGIGMKEASHFLRNTGAKDLAIVDLHVLDFLRKRNMIPDVRLSKKRYLEIEEVLRVLSREVGISLAELDLCIWYIETGKVLK